MDFLYDKQTRFDRLEDAGIKYYNEPKVEDFVAQEGHNHAHKSPLGRVRIVVNGFTAPDKVNTMLVRDTNKPSHA